MGYADIYDVLPYEKYRLNTGDILISHINSLPYLGRTVMYYAKENETIIHGMNLLRLIPDKNIIPNFIVFAFRTSKFKRQIDRNAHQAVNQASTNIAAFSGLLIPLPPLAEQKRIVAEIEKWFALIDELDANKQDLQVAIRQVRAKVLDLAIHGKLVPQDPNDEPAIALLRRINPHFTPSDTSHYQNPPFDIPASWQWVRVSDIAKTITGGTPSKNKPQYYGGTFPFYKPADLDAGRNVIVASEYLSEEGKSISRVIPPNSIAICCIGSIGKCGYLAKECTTYQQINTIVPYTNIFPLLIYYYCCSSFFKQQLVDKSSAITISIVNKSKLEDTLLPLPPLAEQKRIVSEIERIFGVLGTIEENIR